MCSYAYAVTLEGAKKLQARYSLEWLASPLDVELMIGCSGGQLRCLDVYPNLVGVYRAPGMSARKGSDIDPNSDPNAQHPGENPMGEWGVQNQLRKMYNRQQ